MQYAKIIVDATLSGKKDLTYSIPAKLLLDIEVGKVVEVPLMNKKVHGVVSGLTKFKPFIGSALPIIKFLSQKPVLSPVHIEFYDFIAKQYLCDLSDVVFSFLPPILKKIPVNKSLVNIRRWKGDIRFVSGHLEDRFRRYKKLINSYSGTLIFIFPDYIVLNNFSLCLKDVDHSIYTGNLNTTDRWNIWERAHLVKIVILSTRIGIGLLPNSKYIIVVDDPDHPGFKENQKPKYQISELLSTHLEYGSNIVVGLSCPTLKYKYLHNYSPITSATNKTIYSGSDLLPDNLVDRLSSYNRILIGMPHKNAFGLLMCKNCTQILRCNECHNPIVQEDQNKTVCVSCKKKLYGFPPCENCHYNSYIGYKFGTNTVEKQISKMLPNRNILRLDNNQDEISTAKLRSAEIIIATSKIFDYPVTKFDLSICIGFDDIIDAPFYNQEESCAALIEKFFALGKENVLISNRNNHRVIRAIAHNKIPLLWTQLLKERFPNYPPYSRLVDIEFTNKPTENQFQILKHLGSQMIVTPDKKISIFVDRRKWLKLIDAKKHFPSNWRYNPDPG